MVNKNNMLGKNSNDLDKTGILYDPKRIIKIGDLIPNKKY